MQFVNTYFIAEPVALTLPTGSSRQRMLHSMNRRAWAPTQAGHGQQVLGPRIPPCALSRSHRSVRAPLQPAQAVRIADSRQSLSRHTDCLLMWLSPLILLAPSCLVFGDSHNSHALCVSSLRPSGAAGALAEQHGDSSSNSRGESCKSPAFPITLREDACSTQDAASG